ncbi:hypothetical protein L596_027347 [Steinernema carpocapsae]|uniref:Uncharacterized protein n=1 Tax=Steinernema carpocapsae TaxID=34508 RepID=A0A4U5M430_STECR|nr:hypothetical protein L596_027347 [Steinernema carpocapsae]
MMRQGGQKTRFYLVAPPPLPSKVKEYSHWLDLLESLAVTEGHRFVCTAPSHRSPFGAFALFSCAELNDILNNCETTFSVFLDLSSTPPYPFATAALKRLETLARIS